MERDRCVLVGPSQGVDVCASAWKSKECKIESINSIRVPAGGSIHIHTHTHANF